MIPDPTDEMRAIKRQLSDACGNDIQRIVEEARRHQEESGKKSVPVPLPQQIVKFLPTQPAIEQHRPTVS